MPTVTYEEFLPDVLTQAVNCPEPLALTAVRGACIDFCTATLLLTRDLDPFSVVANENTYELDVESGYRVARILELYWNNGILTPVSQGELRLRFGTDWQGVGGTPDSFTQFVRAEVVLVPRPTVRATNAVRGRVAIAPTRASTSVDDFIYEDYHDTIVAGALKRILATPGESYSDPQKALFYARVFASDTGASGVEQSTGLVNASLRVQPRRF